MLFEKVLLNKYWLETLNLSNYSGTPSGNLALSISIKIGFLLLKMVEFFMMSSVLDSMKAPPFWSFANEKFEMVNVSMSTLELWLFKN